METYDRSDDSGTAQSRYRQTKDQSHSIQDKEQPLIMADNIPFLDLVTCHKELQSELELVFKHALNTGGFVGGEAVQGFERSFAQFCEVSQCVGVASGTDAVRFCLIAAGVRQGDVVLTVPNTFIATTEAISQAGAEAVFVDVDERTCNMDPEKLREYLETQCFRNHQSGFCVSKKDGKRISAVVPVHLYGQMADMDRIMQLAEQYNLLVIEDACQAHGAQYFSKRLNSWRRAGSMGHASAFSFYPGKNLGACGEAGAVTTNQEELAKKLRMLRDHGQAQKYYHDIEGYNGRLDSIQAGILKVKLGHLAEWNEQRRENARRYSELLSSVDDIILPYEPSWSRSVYHLYVIRVRNRDALKNYLAEANIGTGIHYPIPLHLQKAYSAKEYRQGDLPVAERIASEILSLPMFPNLKIEEQMRVVGAIREFTTKASETTVAACASL